LAVGIDVDQGDAGVGAPADRFEADAAGVPEDDDALHGALRAGEAAFAAVPAEAVADEEVSAGHGEGQAVAVGYQHRRIKAVSAEDIRQLWAWGLVGHVFASCV
jgi:hypothetical protein